MTSSHVLANCAYKNPAPATAPKPAPAPSSSALSPLPVGYNQGLGVGPSPSPLGQHLPAQQPACSPCADRPARSVSARPANQGLLAPLVPTTTGFNEFVPTRPSTPPSFLGPQPTGLLQPSPLAPQPTGFQPSLAPQPTGFQPSLAPQPTGFQSSLAPQPTGFGAGLPFGGPGGVPPVPPLPPSFQNGSFGQLQPRQFSFFVHIISSFSSFAFGYPADIERMSLQSLPDLTLALGSRRSATASTPVPVPPLPSSIAAGPGPAQKDTNPANVFAAMKVGTFANDTAPQSAGEAFLRAVDRRRATS